jgi:hypothetical protein
MAQFGQSDHVIDIHDLTLEALQERFLCLEQTSAVVRQELAVRVPLYDQALQKQYEHLFHLLKRPELVCS